MRRPKAISFDMGYTLLMHAPTGPDLYQRVLAESGVEVGLKAIAAATAPAHEHYIRCVREGRDFEASMEQALAFWAEYNAIVLTGLGVPETRHATLAERIYTTAWQPQNWKIFPEVMATLEALREEGIRMLVLSNFVDTLRAVCELHQVAGYFDDIIASVDAGAMKPDPRIFRLGLRRLGIQPEDAWHVGDNYWADVLGSRAVGMTPVLVDRQRAVPHPDCLVVHSLDELVAMVRSAEESEAAA
jgi:putative hydrolase of the HAD superfamily